MTRYIWQRPDWPNLRWNSEALLLPLGKARRAQGDLLGKAGFVGLSRQAEVLTEEAFTTSAIEGEKLDRASLRSSVARRLGLPTAGLPPTERRLDGLVEMLVDATVNNGKPLTATRLFGWHAALFPTGYSGLNRIRAGKWRVGVEPMRVVSGPEGKEKVHFEAPPAARVKPEMDGFLKWWNAASPDMDGLVRAAMAHFRFVTIHPFEDGNGRIARAITDMALAQDEKKESRLYSMSAQINVERRDYYEVLEKTQKGDGDITGWVAWFLGCLERALERSGREVDKAVAKLRFWERWAEVGFTERQKKVLNVLLDAGPGGFEGGLTNRKYKGMTHVSPETAKRDIADLLIKGVLVRNPGGGRSASYDLAWPEGSGSEGASHAER